MANIKMSPFDENHAAGWFIVLEAQFEVKNVTQSPTKFYNVLSHIPVDVAERLPEIGEDLVKHRNNHGQHLTESYMQLSCPLSISSQV